MKSSMVFTSYYLPKTCINGETDTATAPIHHMGYLQSSLLGRERQQHPANSWSVVVANDEVYVSLFFAWRHGR
jgi:hypothetical protein